MNQTSEEAFMLIPEIMQTVIVGLMILLPVCFIYAKAGFNPLWAALVFLPGLGLFLIVLHLALMPWPNSKNGER